MKKLIRTILIAALLMTMFTGTVYAGSGGMFKGKTVFIAGDSLQNPRQYDKYGAFIQRVCERFKADKIKNRARSNATLANARNDQALSTYRQVMGAGKKLRKYDIIFISAGTNDYGGDSYGYVKVDKMKKDLNKLLKYIHKKSPKSKVVVVTPIYRYAFNGYNDCEEMPNWKDRKTLKEYRNAIKEVARKKRFRKYVRVINGAKLVSKDMIKRSKYTWDFLHPKVNCVKKAIVPNFKKELIKRKDFFK